MCFTFFKKIFDCYAQNTLLGDKSNWKQNHSIAVLEETLGVVRWLSGSVLKIEPVGFNVELDEMHASPA